MEFKFLQVLDKITHMQLYLRLENCWLLAQVLSTLSILTLVKSSFHSFPYIYWFCMFREHWQTLFFHISFINIKKLDYSILKKNIKKSWK